MAEEIRYRSKSRPNHGDSRPSQFSGSGQEESAPLPYRSSSYHVDDLSDLPSDRTDLANFPTNMKHFSQDHDMSGDNSSQIRQSPSITSMDSYASSILQLSERRASIYSANSMQSPESDPSSPGIDPTHSPNPIGIVDDFEYGGGQKLQSSLPETAALARLTCQQVDEMMSLVLAMIRRMDQLDDRVSAMLPQDQQPSDDPDHNRADWTQFLYKGAIVLGIPLLVAATVSYFRGDRRRR